MTKLQPAISVLTDGTLTEEKRCAKVCCIHDSSAQLADRMRCKTSEAKDLLQMKSAVKDPFTLKTFHFERSLVVSAGSVEV